MFLHYFRTTPDGRVLMGSGSGRLEPGRPGRRRRARRRCRRRRARTRAAGAPPRAGGRADRGTLERPDRRLRRPAAALRHRPGHADPLRRRLLRATGSGRAGSAARSSPRSRSARRTSGRRCRSSNAARGGCRRSRSATPAAGSSAGGRWPRRRRSARGGEPSARRPRRRRDPAAPADADRRALAQIRHVARPFLTRYCWWYSSAGQKVDAAAISVAIGLPKRDCARAFDSAATSACSGRVGEDRRAVLGADVPALAVHLGRVVEAPEPVDELAVGDLVRVERDLDRLGVAGRAVADRACSRARRRDRRCSRPGRR